MERAWSQMWTTQVRDLFKDYEVLDCLPPRKDAHIVLRDNSLINKLPDEVLTRIFNYLDPVRDLVPALALVCKRWRNILKTGGPLWRSIHVDPTHFQYWNFSLLFSIFRLYGHHVQKLTWKESAPVYESVFALVPRLTSLRCLRLPILWTRAVLDSLLPLGQLEDVQINGGFTITDEELRMIAQSFPHLKTISLNACWSITSFGVNNLLDNLSQLETVKLKINSGLPLNDIRSEDSMMQGSFIVQTVADSIHAHKITVLCLHYVSIEMDELWHVINSLKSLKKLSISNCEHLHGIRMLSSSLQKLYLYNLWNVLFISIKATNLKLANFDHGLESLEHLEMVTPRLRRLQVDGCNCLHTINVRSQKLVFLEVDNCSQLDMRSFRETLQHNESIVSLKVGSLPVDEMYINEAFCPNIQELCLLGSFNPSVLHLRSPTLRLLHSSADSDIENLSYVYIVANHICKVALFGMPTMRNITIQCVSIDALELNLCSDTPMVLESLVIQACVSTGFLRLFDCDVKLLSVSSPVVKTLVLYRCVIADYTLMMMLKGCPNITHLCLEKTQNIGDISVSQKSLEYLNIYDCTGISKLDLYCPSLKALNIGHCTCMKLLWQGEEVASHDLVDKYDIDTVHPGQSKRWSHDLPPQVYASR